MPIDALQNWRSTFLELLFNQTLYLPIPITSERELVLFRAAIPTKLNRLQTEREDQLNIMPNQAPASLVDVLTASGGAEPAGK